MKVSKEKVAEHRKAILEAAGRLFRARGFDDVSVSDVMKEAGLTHGAFYGYFPSKEALIAEAVSAALAPEPAKARRTVADFADAYLGTRHRMDALYGEGFDYTYLIPGLRKVVQAAGRVIRTEHDRGVVHLLDDRFAQPGVRALLPAWWRITSS